MKTESDEHSAISNWLNAFLMSMAIATQSGLTSNTVDMVKVAWEIPPLLVPN